MSAHETFEVQRLPALRKFWKAVWIDEEPLKKEQVTNDNVSRYLDFGEHFNAVKLFCNPVQKKLCIYQEYVDAFESFEADLNIYETGACIIREPGIGKAKPCFIAYAVFERLRKKEPVAVEVTFWEKSTERYLLFTSEGVTLRYSFDTDALQRHPGIWAFSDSNVHTLIPTAAFIYTSGVRVFQVTSPKEVRYKEWTKQNCVSYYLMNLPSEKDIQHLSLVLGKDVTTMRSLADQWGHVPRVLLYLYGDPGAQRIREHMVRRQVDKSTLDISRTLDALSALDSASSDGPSPIFFIQPLRTECDGLVRRDCDIFIPTRWLRDEVADGILRREDSERAKLFKLMSGPAKTRTTAGNVFESIVHRVLSGGNELFVHWYKNPRRRQPITALSFPTLLTWSANVDLRAVDTPFFYLRPESENFAAIDGAIFTADCIYLIQATIAMTHSFKTEGVNKFHNALPADRKALPKKLLVVGHTKRQTDEVTKHLISQVRKANITWDVGSITLDVDAGFRVMANDDTS